MYCRGHLALLRPGNRARRVNASTACLAIYLLSVYNRDETEFQKIGGILVLTLLYALFKQFVGVCFNLLNFLLLGNLPPLGSVCVIIEDEGKYLLVKRPDGAYVFPGGFMRWKERPAQSAERECLEETGLSITIKGLIGCSANPSEKLTKMSSLTMIYRAAVIDGQLRNTIEGQACWLDATELPSRLYKQQRGIYDHYLRRQAQNEL